MQGRRQSRNKHRSAPAALRLGGFIVLTLALLESSAWADPQTTRPVFYHQLIDLGLRGHAPSRTVILITEPDGTTRLAADDDPRLAFNLLWLEQHRQGYRYREGGAALGKLFRSILRQAWDNYRDDGGSFLSKFPTGDDAVARADRSGGRYDLRVSDDEIELGFEYRW